MKKLIISTLVFSICLWIAPFFIGIAGISADSIDAWLRTSPTGEPYSQKDWENLFVSFLGALVIYYGVLPILAFPLSAAAPVASSYKDTAPLRFAKYIGLCVLAFLFPSILYFVLGTISNDVGGSILYLNKAFPNWGDAVKFFSLFDGNPKMKLAALALHYPPIIMTIISAYFVYFFHVVLFEFFAPFMKKLNEWADESNMGKGGSSRFANMTEEIAEVWTGKGKTALFFGNSLFIPWLQIGRDNDRHMITFAGSGSGKGTSCIIPNLLVWQGSVLCIDPKGTNYAVTKSRRKRLGNVHVFDPFKIRAESSDSFNPLLEIDVNDPEGSAIDAIDTIVESIIEDEPKNIYFSNEARALLRGYIAYVLTDKAAYPVPSLIDVFDIIMTKTPEEKDIIHAKMLTNTSPILKDLTIETAYRVKDGLQVGKKSTEFHNVMSTLKSQIRWMASPPIKRLLRTSSVSFLDMRNQNTSIFLIMTPEHARRYQKLQRLLVNSSLKAVQKGGRPPVPCLFLIDEAATLGHMKEIAEAYAMLRSFNTVVWTFWQDKGQLDALYPTAETFLSSSRAVQVFGGVEAKTTDYVTEKLGSRLVQATINPLGSRATNQPLRMRDEIEREVSTERQKMYVFQKGQRPMILRRVDYFKSLYWYIMADPDPDFPNSQKPFLIQMKEEFEEFIAQLKSG